MIDLSHEHFWQPICPVDVTALALWLAAGGQPWIVQPDTLRKPQRLLDPQYVGRAMPLVESVLRVLEPTLRAYWAYEVVLSKMEPGQAHPMHQDQQPHQWVTRVHIPIVTNLGAWHEFEDEGAQFHLPAGQAYTFNAVRRHSFGNGGDTARTHLIFDVRTA